MEKNKFCVLVVDDQKESVSALIAMMERRGFECHYAANLVDAEKTLDQVLPHLLIVDVQLGPNQNGLNWLAQVRKGPFTNVHAVVMTGLGDKETVREAVYLGVADYIVKPSSQTVLAKKIVTIQNKLAEQQCYSLTVGAEPVTATASMSLHVSAISETGICVSSHISNRSFITFSNPQSDLFEEMGVSPLKKITFLNHERETGRYVTSPIRNFCQANGWTEPDFKRVRVWMRKNRLGRSY